jgi:predicted metal-dependent hydrolase
LRLDAASREAVVVTPSERYAERAAAFALTRAGWLSAQLARLPKVVPLLPGSTIPFRGLPHTLRHGDGRARARVEDGAIIVGAPDDDTFSIRVRRFLMAHAKADLEAAVTRHAAKLDVAFARLTVKDTKSRWGSCSSSGALSFSWRVVLAPPFVLNYLAAHETAHLREMNHSSRFWSLVSQCDPAYEEAEAWLRRHGASLHAIGPKG